MEDDKEVPIKLCIKHKTDTTTIEIDKNASVPTLKAAIEKVLSIPQNEQRLLFKGVYIFTI